VAISTKTTGKNATKYLMKATEEAYRDTGMTNTDSVIDVRDVWPVGFYKKHCSFYDEQDDNIFDFTFILEKYLKLKTTKNPKRL